MNAHAPSSESGLPRLLGVPDVVAIALGTVIGSGIFIVPATIAVQVRSPLLVLTVWIVGGVLSFLGAISFSELGAAFPDAGGIYVYLREAYGGAVAFLFGWALFFVIDSGAIATLSVAFSSKYLTYFVALPPWATRLVSLSLIASLTAINCAGVRWGARIQNFLTAIKFGAILVVSAAAFLFAHGDTSHFVSPAMPDFTSDRIGAFGVALVASLWAYKGWEVATYSAGEVKKPSRNLPLGLLAGTLAAVGLYLLANLAYLWVFPTTEIASSSRIAADTMRAAMGPKGAALIAVVILFSITGAANGNLLTCPRVFYAMAKDGLFFPSMAKVHPKLQTPYVAIIATGAWASVLCLSGTFEQLVNYVIFGQWIFFGLTVAAVIVLRRRRPELARPYRTWGYPVTPVLFILASGFIAVNTLMQKPVNALVGLGIILLGLPAYAYWRRAPSSASQPAPR